MNPIINTLCFIFDNERVLLAMKKRGFGAGKWNGYGGKVQRGETIEEAARREIKEEAGIDDISLEPRGILRFSWVSAKQRPIECHVFKIISYQGEPIETEEMRPQWFAIDSLPFKEMWSDDPIWLPEFLANKGLKAEFIFDDNDQVIKHSIDFVKHF